MVGIYSAPENRMNRIENATAESGTPRLVTGAAWLDI
jgi:hypothetical protein